MLRKILLSVFVFVAIVAAPAGACSPNQALMQDECYSSCANWAMILYGECSTQCGWNCCQEGSNGGTLCNSSCLASCQIRCNTESCRSLAECEDYCHEW